MDWDVIEQKVESLRFCLNRVQEKCPPSPEELAQDIDAQDIVALNLTRAIQVCVDIATHLIFILTAVLFTAVTTHTCDHFS